MKSEVLKYIREADLLHAGDRVGVAVSGGADSVALLRLLLELRDELGIVLLALHFHHGIRGTEADADEGFVRALAEDHGIEFHSGRGNVPTHAREHKLTIEEAARNLRQLFFRQIAGEQRLHRIATAHTRDDQAETVLMKFIRGAGTRGIAGIYPCQQLEGSPAVIVRPLLCVRRKQIEEYLRGAGQTWCEDASNRDPRFTRNRVRSCLLPVIERELNPAVAQALAHTAEIARAEEDYWNQEVKRLLPLVLLPGKPVRGGGRSVSTSGSPEVALNLELLTRYPLAVQRRLLRAAADSMSIHMDFEHVLAVERLIKETSTSARTGREVELPGGHIAKCGFRELRFECQKPAPAKPYCYELPLGGSCFVAELGTTIYTRLEDGFQNAAEYNQPRSIKLEREGLRLLLRPWQAGDRFWPAYTGAEKKLKELLQPLHLAPEERAIWPVIAADKTIIWVRGLESPPLFVTGEQGSRLLVIEEVSTEVASQGPQTLLSRL